MCMRLHGIPVFAEPSLPVQEIDKIVSQLVKDWIWEGKELGKIEFTVEGHSICVCAYGKPAVKFIPIKNEGEE